MDMQPRGDLIGTLLTELDPSSDEGKTVAVKLADTFLKAEKVRHAQVEGVKVLYEAESGDLDDKAVAALTFCSSVARAETQFAMAMRSAVLGLLEDVLGKKVPPAVLQMMISEAMGEPPDPGQILGKIQECPEFMDFVEEQAQEHGGDITAMVEIGIRKDGIMRVGRLDGEGQLFFDAEGNYLGDEEPDGADGADVALGEATIDGIDFGATFDPDKNGRKIRDFDGNEE